MQTRPFHLKFDDWRPGDRVAWKALFAEGEDLLDDQGPCIGWSYGSRKKRLQSSSRWLGYLQETNRLLDTTNLVEQATPEVVGEFVTSLQNRCKSITVHIVIEDLWFVLRAIDPKRDWGWLGRLVCRLRSVADIGYLKPVPGITAAQIFSWALQRLAEVDSESDVTDLPRAVRYRDALQAGLLISMPVRRRAFVAMLIDALAEGADGSYSFEFKPADMKDKKRHDFPLHPQLVGPFFSYLKVYRQVLLQGKSSDRLWITARGAPTCADSFYGHLVDLTQREFGVRLSPHAFRHVAATSIAWEDPEHVNIIAAVLGHSTLAMAHKHYIHAGNRRAIASYQDLTAALHNEARKRERRSNGSGREENF